MVIMAYTPYNPKQPTWWEIMQQNNPYSFKGMPVVKPPMPGDANFRGPLQPPIVPQPGDANFVGPQVGLLQNPNANATPKNQKAAIIMGALSDIFRGQDTTQNTIARQQQMVAMDAQRKAQERFQKAYDNASPDMKKIMGNYTPEQWTQMSAQLDIAKLQPPDYKIQKLEDDNYYYVDPTGNRPPIPVSNIEAKVDPKPQSDLENQLRDEFNNMSGEFIKVRDAYSRVDAAGKEPSAAGDLALIFNYMKMLDPGSTVREGEFANAQNSAGVPQRIQAKYNEVVSGERLSDETRLDFLDRSDSLYQVAYNNQIALKGAYSNIAKNNKVNVDNVVIPYEESVSNIVFSNKINQMSLNELENYDRSNLSEEQIKMLDQMITMKTVPNSNADLVPNSTIDALVEKYKTK